MRNGYVDASFGHAIVKLILDREHGIAHGLK